MPDLTTLRATVARTVQETPVLDIHTHLFAPAFGGLLLYGIDELLSYHYLTAESSRTSHSVPMEIYWNMEKMARTDYAWDVLFKRCSPVSEACRGVITCLNKLGLETRPRDLKSIRAWFREVDVSAHVDRVFKAAHLEAVVMTNDPFDDTERSVWLEGFQGDPRFLAALRIDALLCDWPNAWRRLAGWGYKVEETLSVDTLAEIRRFLEDWLERTNALYMAVSLPPSFAFPGANDTSRLLTECILPIAAAHKLPFAIMLGVSRSVNPELRLAGDGVGRCEVESIQRLCAAFQENRFLVTLLSRENQHQLTVAARKFANLHLFGCWWFLNIPSMIDEITRMRLEMLGLSFTPQHSDARVLEQVIYKWDHSREVITGILQDRYCDLARSGWTATDKEIKRDVRMLFGGAFRDFLEGC